MLVSSGCDVVNVDSASGATTPGSTAQDGPAEQPSATSTPAVLRITPAANARSVTPSTPVVVTADSGTIDSVVVTDEQGTAVKGSLTGDTWKSAGRLRPAASYTVAVKATGEDGTPTTKSATFRTLKPKVTATYGILYAGQTVGVGMPVSIQFDSAVTTQAQRAQVERLVKVTTVPAQKGAWGWLDNRQLMWRPARYWQPGTKVTVSAPLTGVQTGPGKWVAKDDAASFTVGDSVVSTVNIKTHQMTVRRNGQVVRTIPVSTGNPGPLTETRSGTKVIIRKEGEVVMDSATVGIPKGDPDYYRQKTQYNLRLTWTGEYIHSAPWSVGAQGSANVSHGCVNLSPANAQWMYENSRVGDVVTFTGSSRPFIPTEGIGVWEYDNAGWASQSALR